MSVFGCTGGIFSGEKSFKRHWQPAKYRVRPLVVRSRIQQAEIGMSIGIGISLSYIIYNTYYICFSSSKCLALISTKFTKISWKIPWKMPGFVSPLLFPFQVFNRCSGCRLPGSHSGRRWTHQRWDISLRWPEFIEQPGRSNSWMREVAILSQLKPA